MKPLTGAKANVSELIRVKANRQSIKPRRLL
jgi:hypothetical protein